MQSVTTGADGGFRMDELTAGEYRLTRRIPEGSDRTTNDSFVFKVGSEGGIAPVHFGTPPRCEHFGGQMYAPLSRFVEPSYAIMRIAVGLLFAFHGAQKLFGIFGGTVQPIASQRGLAGMIELGGGVLVMIGLLAGLAAFLCSGLMAFAYFLVHAPRGGWPIQNDGELAVVFCFIFLFIAARGAGIWSLEAALFRRGRPMHTAPTDGWSQA